MNYQVRINDASDKGVIIDNARKLEELSVQRLCRRLVVFNPAQDQIVEMVDRARQDLPTLTDSQIIKKVAVHNPDSFWAVQKKNSYSNGNTKPEGFIALLLLNEDGVSALLSGELDRKNPPLEMLVEQHERPAGIYVWVLHAKGTLAPAVSLVRDKLCTPYSDVEIFAVAASEAGGRFMESLGYKKGVWWKGEYVPDFYHYHLGARDGAEEASDCAQDLRPPYDSYRYSQNAQVRIGVTAVHTIDEFMKVLSIRAAVYVAEQKCPYDEEYDGNDFSASHLLAYVGNEPVGCIRMRFFAGFAKIERLAVRKEFRHMGVASHLVQGGIELSRIKGYQQIYAHSQKRLADFWKKYGFAEPENAREFVFSDFDYIELRLEADSHSAAISPRTDPLVLIRPEGRWDQAGILEHSASRPVTRPSVNC